MGHVPKDAQRRGEAGDGVAVAADDALLRELLVEEGLAGDGAPVQPFFASCVRKNIRNVSGSRVEESRRGWRVWERPGSCLPPEWSEIRRMLRRTLA